MTDEERRSDLPSSLLKILEAAMEVDHAVLGNIQVFNRDLGGLEIRAQRGFDPSFMEFFKLVRPEDSCACGRALRLRKRVNIPDIQADPFFQSFLDVAHQAGFRSVQSTPIVNSNSDIVGMLSTHFADVHYLSHEGAARLDRFAFAAADVIGRSD